MIRDLSPSERIGVEPGSASLNLSLFMSRFGDAPINLDSWINNFSPSVDMNFNIMHPANITGTNGTAVLQVVSTKDLIAGYQIIFGGILGQTRIRTILTVDSATQITVNSSITTVDGETIRHLITPPTDLSARLFLFIPPRDNTVGVILMDRYGQTGLRVAPNGPIVLSLDSGANNQPYYQFITDGDVALPGCRVLFF